MKRVAQSDNEAMAKVTMELELVCPTLLFFAPAGGVVFVALVDFSLLIDEVEWFAEPTVAGDAVVNAPVGDVAVVLDVALASAPTTALASAGTVVVVVVVGVTSRLLISGLPFTIRVETAKAKMAKIGRRRMRCIF